MFEPPKSYNEVLPELHKATFLNTLMYYMLLVIYECIPLITSPTKYVPPIKDHKNSISWALSFGILPCAFTIFTYLINGALDLHNNTAKLLRVRYLQDKHLVIKPLSRRAGVNRKLDKDEAHNAMNSLYYSEVRKIKNKRYVELFWNKVYYFWIFFEFSVIALTSFLIIFFCKQTDIFRVEDSLLFLFFFVVLSFSVSGIIFTLTVKPKTESQVGKVPNDKIKEFFTKSNINQMVLALNYNMHGVNIRSGNAAKPHTMPSRYLCKYIRSIEKNGRTLGFGCGKLRYSDELISKFGKVTLLDSKRQLEREQIIRGVETGVIDYVPRYYKSANTVASEDVNKIVGGYDFIPCSNVLSAVPCRDTIDKVVLNTKRLLKPGGETLIVNQYKSSYFGKYEIERKHLYRYIYKSSKSVSYYGLLDELTMQEICSSHGLEILKSWSKARSSYITVGDCDAI